MADLELVPEAAKMALPKGGRKGMTGAEEKILIIISRPAVELLGAADTVRLKALLETLCRGMGFTGAYISKDHHGVRVWFLPGKRD